MSKRQRELNWDVEMTQVEKIAVRVFMSARLGTGATVRLDIDKVVATCDYTSVP